MLICRRVSLRSIEYRLVGVGEAVAVPLTDEFQMVVHRWIPIFGCVVNRRQIATVVGWQVGGTYMFQQ